MFDKRVRRNRKKLNIPTFEEHPEEKILLEEVLADVRPLKTKKTTPRKNGQKTVSTVSTNQENELLKDFIAGKVGFDWTFHPGYQQGGPQEHNSRLIRSLRRGNYSVQGQLDLHGLIQAEALEALEIFLNDSCKRGLSCVRIIHGKGNHSASHQGILKRRVPEWLKMRRLSRLIVAFTSATPKDGGIGATYVLLKKKPTGRKGS